MESKCGCLRSTERQTNKQTKGAHFSFSPTDYAIYILFRFYAWQLVLFVKANHRLTLLPHAHLPFSTRCACVCMALAHILCALTHIRLINITRKIFKMTISFRRIWRAQLNGGKMAGAERQGLSSTREIRMGG